MSVAQECVEELRGTQNNIEAVKECICSRAPDAPQCSSRNSSFNARSGITSLIGNLELDAEAVFSFLRKQDQNKIEININQVSTEAKQVYNTSFILKESGANGSFNQVKLSNDQKRGAKLPQDFHSGFELEIIPVTKEIRELKTYVTERNYYSKAQLSDNTNKSYFIQSTPSNDGLVSCNQEELEKPAFPILSSLNVGKFKEKNKDAYYQTKQLRPDGLSALNFGLYPEKAKKSI